MPVDRRDDPYTLLGIPMGAGPREITVAYRRRVRQLHPDTPGGDAELLAAVVAAYQLLRDPQRRAAYDRRRAQQEHTTFHRSSGVTDPVEHGTPIPVRVRRAPPRPRRSPDLRVGPVRYHPR